MLLVAVTILAGGMVNVTILLVILASIFHRYRGASQGYVQNFRSPA